MAVDREPVSPVDALAAATDRDPEDLRAHPRLLLTALGELGRGIVTTALDLGDADPDVRADAERRRTQLLAVLTRGRRPDESAG